MNIEDLLIDFDEMGFAPTTTCPNPDEYACEWRMKLVAEINRKQAEIERLKIENQSLRGAANSYKIHYENAVKNFEEFAQHAYIDNPFACQYCVHSVEDGRACLWKEEHEKDGVSVSENISNTILIKWQVIQNED